MSEKILTANRLRDGIVVFLDPGDVWVERAGDARIAGAEAGRAALEAAGRAAVAAGLVVEPYLIDVARDADGRPAPIRYRERLRAQASTHPHFGQQAEIPSRPRSEEAA